MTLLKLVDEFDNHVTVDVLKENFHGSAKRVLLFTQLSYSETNYLSGDPEAAYNRAVEEKRLITIIVRKEVVEITNPESRYRRTERKVRKYFLGIGTDIDEIAAEMLELFHPWYAQYLKDQEGSE